MATVINNPPSSPETEGGLGWVIGLIIALLLIGLIFYGFPALRGANRGGGANVNIPDRVDVNVNKTPAPAPQTGQ